MPLYRSTKLSLYLNRCAHAVTLYERGEQWDRSIFATGVASHDILQALGEHPHDNRDAVMRAVTTRLIREGRVGHDAEGPLAPDAVYAGRDLVVDWLNWGGDPAPVPGLFEPGFGFTLPDWKLCGYEAADFGIHPDAVYPIETDEGRGLVVRDYKTGWNAGPEMLDSLQLRSQAVAVWMASERLHPSDWPGVKTTERWHRPDFIRREVVGIRLRDSWHEDTWLDAEGLHLLKRWRQDIEDTVAALETGAREPRVSRKCISCPFSRKCEAWLQHAPADDPADVAETYILATAMAKRLEEVVREATDETPIAINDTVVGTVGRPSTKVDVEAAAKAIVGEWFDGQMVDAGTASAMVGMVKALKPGVTQLKAFAKVAFNGEDKKTKRARFVERVTYQKMGRRFGVWSPEEVKG
jgi:hypothetical protein